MNPELRAFLLAWRTIVAYISALTPTKYDDQILTWIDYLLGDVAVPSGKLAQAMQVQLNIPWDKLPWDKIVPLLLPLLMKLLEQWLASVNGGGSTPPKPPQTDFNTEERGCAK